LHIYLLHAPDFLGYESAVHLAKDHPAIVERGLRLKKAGNDLMTLLGGRAVHPINVRVGGFYRVPTRRELVPVTEQLKWARDAALETARWTGTLEFPHYEQDYEFVALSHPDEYAITEGRLVSNQGLDIAVREYDAHFVEEHIPYSNALHSSLKDRGAYLVGPLARYNLNFDRLSPLAREAARAAGLGPTCRNPFQSIVVRSVEILYACDEALRLIAQYEPPERPSWRSPRARGRGTGAPRRRAASSTTATPSTTRASSRTRRLCRPRHRTRRPSRRTCGLSLIRASTSRRRPSPGSASRPSATTTPASPAPPTSSPCG